MKNSLINKICLGTAQFGFEYGINNPRGKIPQREVFEILLYCHQIGINYLDTAYNYGESETVIGKFLRQNTKSWDLKIITKLPENENVREVFMESLNRLGIRKTYGYLVHNFEFFRKKNYIWDRMVQLKREGKTEKIGFSLYFPEEYYIIKDLEIDILQIPYNIFDRRFETLLPELKRKGIEIHTRSAFLQGLIFKKPDELNGKFIKIKDRLIYLTELARESGLPLSSIFLNFCSINKYIDKVLIGVDNLEQLKNNIDFLSYHESVTGIYKKLLELKEDDEDIILPLRWKT